MKGPLSDIRVLDAATFLAAPFCGTILADFGAEVIKIEQPGSGDSLRGFGTATSCGDTYVWLSEARNKKSVTLDLRTEEGAALFRQLVERSDVVLENFRPGTLQRWGLGFDTLVKINPKLVMLSVTGYGQTGPYRDLPGFARVAHAFGGLAYLAGEPGQRPVVPGSSSLADYMSGMFGAIGVLIALRHAQQTGEGQEVDIALYESVFRVLDEMVSTYAATGYQRERMGADTVNAVPHSHYETADGAWVALACSNDRMWRRLARAMGRPKLANDPLYATTNARVERRDAINTLVTDWIGGLPLASVLEHCRREDVPCAKLLSASDIFDDPHYVARNNMIRLETSRAGPLCVPAPVPRLSKTPPQLRHVGPALGASNEEIFGSLLGLSASSIAELQSRGVI